MIELPRRVYYLSQLDWAQRHSCFVVGVALQEIGEAELEWERAVQKLDLETKHITAAGPVAPKWEPCFEALREGARPCMRDCVRDCMRNGSRASMRCERVRALATDCALPRAPLAACHVCTRPMAARTHTVTRPMTARTHTVTLSLARSPPRRRVATHRGGGALSSDCGQSVAAAAAALLLRGRCRRAATACRHIASRHGAHRHDAEARVYARNQQLVDEAGAR